MTAATASHNRRAISSHTSVPRLIVAYLVLVVALYALVLHPWMMTWGTTASERAMPLAGDEVVPDADLQVTRAITINAPVTTVWAWVAQMGQDRAGFYSYTWIENLLGADIHSADRIHPEWQGPQVGQIVSMTRADYLGGRLAFTRAPIVRIDPERAFITRGWGALVLQPVDARTTRLFVRDRSGSTHDPGAARFTTRLFGWLFWDPGHFVMQRQMLRGIKASAEGHHDPPAALEIPARIGWSIAALSVLGLFLADRRRRPWVLVPLALAAPVLWKTGDWDAALAGFLALGITLVGALRFGRRWWRVFPAGASAILLLLALAPDAYIAFGLLADITLLSGCAPFVGRWARRREALGWRHA